jgi:hypothetical protein
MPRLLGSPVLAASGDGRLELFVVGGDGGLWHTWQTQASSGWSPWVSAGRPLPGAACGDPGRPLMTTAGSLTVAGSRP